MRRGRGAKFARWLVAVGVAFLAYLEFFIVAVPLPRWAVLLIALLPAAGAGAVVYSDSRERAEVSGPQVLRAMLSSLWGKDADRYRTNVMCPDPDGKALKIRFAENLEGHVDQHMVLHAGKGCAGLCFQSRDVTLFDFTRMGHEAFGVDARRTPVWADLRSILSYPIEDASGKVVGVLNIDSSEPMERTKFLDSNIQRAVGLYAGLLRSLVDAG